MQSRSPGPGPVLAAWTVTDGCHRSTKSYARLLAGFVAARQAQYVACSGAIVANLYLGQNGEPAQLGSLSSDTDLVTLTIGGNDAGFPDVLTHCVRLLN